MRPRLTLYVCREQPAPQGQQQAAGGGDSGSAAPFGGYGRWVLGGARCLLSLPCGVAGDRLLQVAAERQRPSQLFSSSFILENTCREPCPGAPDPCWAFISSEQDLRGPVPCRGAVSVGLLCSQQPPGPGGHFLSFPYTVFHTILNPLGDT